MEGISDLIECSICLEKFTDPRMLPCIHTFCLKCLQQIVLNMDAQQPRHKLPCPICRIEFDIPPQGAEGFQKNFFMLRLKEITAIRKPLDRSCDMCLESKERDEDEVLPADVYCLQCRKQICRRCSKNHRSIAELKEHQLVKLGTEATEDFLKTIFQQDCNRHKSEKAKMYCSDCSEAICVVCFAENHQTHQCCGVEKAGETFREEIEEVTRTIEICLNEKLTKIQQCTDEKTNFQNNVENIEQKINTRKNELIALVEKCAHSLFEELATIRQTRLNEIQHKVEENEKQLVIVESFKAYCEQIQAKGTNVELCQVAPTVKRRAEAIMETHRAHCHQPAELIQLDFKQTNLEEVVTSENAIGRIEVVSEFIRRRGRLAIPSSFEVYGVTKLENKICILCQQPNAILIFHDQKPFRLQTEIDLKQTETPFHIDSSEKSKGVYVAEFDSDRIWKITTNDRRVIKWSTCDGKKLGCPSVTSEDHVLVFDYRHPHKLEIYTSDAELLSHLYLPSNIYKPQHVIRKPNGEFIIIHHEGALNGPYAISRLTSDGQTVICRVIQKAGLQDLSEPLHLALDSANNRLFVADYGNDRVILLDSVSLNLIKVLLTRKENGISHPWRLFYDGRKKQLIVVHSSNIVDVYEVCSRKLNIFANEATL